MIPQPPFFVNIKEKTTSCGGLAGPPKALVAFGKKEQASVKAILFEQVQK